jgi:pimeloyl-ACP methyl ester carboxylesterase
MIPPTEQPWEPADDADASYALFAKEGRVVVDDGTPIAYTHRNADGPNATIVLANGWSCSDAYWGPIVPLLEAAGHPILLADTRGHGRSGLPRDPGRGAANLRVADVSMARIAADLLAVADDAGVDRFVVVGHSMGVQTGLEVCRAAPERVLGLVLVAGTAENPAKTFYGTSIGDALFPITATVARWLPELLVPVQLAFGPATVGHSLARLARAAGPRATIEDLRPYLAHLRTIDPAVVVLMAQAMREHSAVDLLPEIAAPTLVVAAGADVFTPARCSEALHHGIAGSELLRFPGAGHTLPIEEPEPLAAAIVGFAARRIGPVSPPAARARRGSSGGGSRGSRPARSRRASPAS